MSLSPPAAATPTTPPRRRTRLRAQVAGGAHSVLAQGESLVWLTGGALVVCLAMILGLLVLIVVQGGPTFWPALVVRIETWSGKDFIGEVSRTDQFQPTERDFVEQLPAKMVAAAQQRVADAGGIARRRLIRSQNWVSDFAIRDESFPEWMTLFERLEDGRLYGEPVGYVLNDQRNTEMEPAEAWAFYLEHHAPAVARQHQIDRLTKRDLGGISNERDAARLRIRSAELQYGPGSPQVIAEEQNEQDKQSAWDERTAEIQEQINQLKEENQKYRLLVKTSNDEIVAVPLEQIVRAFAPNRLGLLGKSAVYFARWGEFLGGSPRNSNLEGGVFPAIFGTVAMTLIMSLLVTPFGVLAALYLREYAKSGATVSLIRIAINNLAGVPSIVFGVFGLGFFVNQVGTYIDGGPQHARIPTLSPAIWFAVLALLAVTAAGAFLCGLFSLSSRSAESGWQKRLLGRGSVVLWLATTGLTIWLIATTPFFHGFFRAELPGTPTFGQGGILWAALTLSLLTLPVVIVATEEALSAVPNSMREGSYACGAGKWQTIRRIVLPHALPGIMTGMILAMSRGAGEVAPLMMVGALAKAPKLPIDIEFPFVHAQRPFMHLALHIFDLGFASPNSEAAKPTVFTTALLLIAIVAALNLTAVWLRARLRKAYQAGQF